MPRSTLTAPMLERQLVLVRDELQRTKRDLQTARDGAVQVPIVTPGQLAEVRAIATQLHESAAAAQSIADSVTNWVQQLQRFTPALPSPEEQPTK